MEYLLIFPYRDRREWEKVNGSYVRKVGRPF
jgi:hypothetical protein